MAANTVLTCCSSFKFLSIPRKLLVKMSSGCEKTCGKALATSSGCHNCEQKCGAHSTSIDSSAMKNMEVKYQKLMDSNSKSLLKKYLTRPMFDKLKVKKTGFGSTLMDCIQSGNITFF